MQPHELDSALIRYFSEQSQRYCQLEAALQRVSTESNSPGEAIEQVNAIMRTIVECDEQHRRLRELWQATEASASPELKQISQHVTEQIKLLLNHVSSAQTNTHAAMDQVRVEMSEEALRRKAIAAYSS